MSFNHPALNLTDNKKLVYTAFSKHYFYYRAHISQFVLEHNAVPLNPFMLFDYFLTDAVDRDIIRQANNNVIRACDELWVIGPVSNGVLAEILLAKKLNKPISYYQINKPHNIEPISLDKVEMEADIADSKLLLS